MASAVPEVEIADDADSLRIRREDGEGNAFDTVLNHQVGAKLLVEVHMRALAEQIEIEVTEHRQEAIRIFELDDVIAKARAQAIAPRSVR